MGKELHLLYTGQEFQTCKELLSVASIKSGKKEQRYQRSVRIRECQRL